MSDRPFELDENGMIVTRPLLGWTIAPVAGMSVLAKLSYAETPADIGTEGRSVQLVMTPRQALELAAVLTRQARGILDARPGSVQA